MKRVLHILGFVLMVITPFGFVIAGALLLYKRGKRGKAEDTN